MDPHIRTLRKEELHRDYGGWFDEENAERVVSWLVASENRSPVVLVGAGFTLNARDRSTGKPATRAQAPLWGEVVGRLAADLAIGPDRYDAPTLFELYGEALGPAKLRDALCSAVADAELQPGAAHEALATYPCEAILTTNCLDTLLDKACGPLWRRVVVDADLSMSAQSRELIYLHGHRASSDSWVMTRSQYEDFPRAKPVILARTRQLLAQHPWVIVGFSMADANFHAITRLLGMEMRSHQPLSLALMPSLPPAAERLHWRRLGFEIVAPSPEELKTREFGEFLAWIFPKLVTSYSPTSKAAKAFIGRGVTAAERLRRFRLVNPPPIVDRDATYRDWLEQIKSALTVEERTHAADAARTAMAADLFRMTKTPKEGSEVPTPEVVTPSALPELRHPIFRDLEKLVSSFQSVASFELAHWLATLLAKEQEIRNEVAEHFAWALEHHVFAGARSDLPLDILSLRLANDAGWDQRRTHTLLRHAVALTRKYDGKDAERRLEDEAKSLGLELPPDEPGADEPHLTEAKAGYQAFLNADFERAAEHYGRAARLAARLDFEAWTYTTGEADAVRRLESRTWDVRADGSENERSRLEEREKTLRETVDRLAERPVVDRWIKRADSRGRRVLEQVIEVERERERFRVTGSSGSRWGGAAHALWRAFRDLRTIHASPPHQWQYMDPFLSLLDAEDAPLVLALCSKAHSWLNDMLRGAPRTLDDRRERDTGLIEAFFSTSELTKTERVARLKCARAFASVMRASDVVGALKWLQDAAKQVGGGWQETAWSNEQIDGAYWDALSAIARWAEPAPVLEVARELAMQIGDEDAPKALYEFPWGAWKLSSGETAEGFLDLMTSLVSSDPKGAGSRTLMGPAYAVFALARMIDAGLGADALRPHVDDWIALLGRIKATSGDATRFAEARRAAFLLERELVRLELAATRTETQLFAEWFPEKTNGGEDRHDRGELWATLADVVDGAKGALVERLHAEAERLVSDDTAISFFAWNPHLGYGAVQLLCKSMLLRQHDREKTGRFLLALLEAAPSLIDGIADVVAKDLWSGPDWQRLMSLLLASCGGTRIVPAGRDDPGLATRCQIAALDLFTDLDRARLLREEPVLWHAIETFALAAVTDDRLLIANRAAFAVVKIAMDVDDASEAMLCASAIERLARDVRVQVRSAAADGGVGLASRAANEAVRRGAEKAVGEVEGDENALVQRLLERARDREAARSDAAEPREVGDAR